MPCPSTVDLKMDHKVVENKNGQGGKEGRQEIELKSLVGPDRQKDEKPAKERVQRITGRMGNAKGSADCGQFTAVNESDCRC